MVVEHAFEQLAQHGDVDDNWEATQKQVMCSFALYCSGITMLLPHCQQVQNTLAAGAVSLKP